MVVSDARSTCVCRVEVVWIALSGSLCCIKECSGYRDITPKPESSGEEHGEKIQERAMNVASLLRSTGNQKICFLVQGSRSHCTAKESVM